MIARVAQLRPLGNATTQLGVADATATATTKGANARISPMTGRELRAQLLAQQQRNKSASGTLQPAGRSCAPRETRDPDIEHRNALALRMLHEDSTIAVVAESGDAVAEKVLAGASEQPRFRWAVMTPRGWQEVRFWPMATRSDVHRAYPDAIAEPLPEFDRSVTRQYGHA
jgi:hypothetical protein